MLVTSGNIHENVQTHGYIDEIIYFEQYKNKKQNTLTYLNLLLLN